MPKSKKKLTKVFMRFSNTDAMCSVLKSKSWKNNLLNSRA